MGDCIVLNDWYVFEWEKSSEDKALLNSNFSKFVGNTLDKFLFSLFIIYRFFKGYISFKEIMSFKKRFQFLAAKFNLDKFIEDTNRWVAKQTQKPK